MTAQALDQSPLQRGASFTPLQLRRSTPSSYHLLSGDIDQLAAYLQATGYTELGARSSHEAHRLRHSRNGGLAILYRSGTLLCQGQAAQVHSAVAALVEGASDDQLHP